MATIRALILVVTATLAFSKPLYANGSLCESHLTLFASFASAAADKTTNAIVESIIKLEPSFEADDFKKLIDYLANAPDLNVDENFSSQHLEWPWNGAFQILRIINSYLAQRTDRDLIVSVAQEKLRAHIHYMAHVHRVLEVSGRPVDTLIDLANYPGVAGDSIELTWVDDDRAIVRHSGQAADTHDQLEYSVIDFKKSPAQPRVWPLIGVNAGSNEQTLCRIGDGNILFASRCKKNPMHWIYEPMHDQLVEVDDVCLKPSVESHYGEYRMFYGTLEVGVGIWDFSLPRTVKPTMIPLYLSKCTGNVLGVRTISKHLQILYGESDSRLNYVITDDEGISHSRSLSLGRYDQIRNIFPLSETDVVIYLEESTMRVSFDDIEEPIVKYWKPHPNGTNRFALQIAKNGILSGGDWQKLHFSLITEALDIRTVILAPYDADKSQAFLSAIEFAPGLVLASGSHGMLWAVDLRDLQNIKAFDLFAMSPNPYTLETFQNLHKTSDKIRVTSDSGLVVEVSIAMLKNFVNGIK